MAIEMKFTLVEDGRGTNFDDPTSLRVKLNAVPDDNLESGNIELLAKDGLASALRNVDMGTVLSIAFTTLGPKGGPSAKQ